MSFYVFLHVFFCILLLLNYVLALHTAYAHMHTYRSCVRSLVTNSSLCVTKIVCALNDVCLVVWFVGMLFDLTC